MVRNSLIVGHRGAAGLAPENTLAAFQVAWGLGVRAFELDVRLTRDGQLAVIHDATVDRTTVGRGRVAHLTLAEMQGLAIGGAAGRVPSLAEVLASLGTEARWRIELKPEDERPGQLAAAVLAVVTAAGCRERARLISFQERLLAELRARDPRIALGVLQARDVEAAFRAAAAHQCEALMLEVGLVEAAVVARCRAAGLRVGAWTANRPEQIRRLLDLGVDEVITDFPDRALQVMGGGTG